MTNSNDRWTDERLDRLAANVEANARAIDLLIKLGEIHQLQIDGLRLEVRRLIEDIRRG